MPSGECRVRRDETAWVVSRNVNVLEIQRIGVLKDEREVIERWIQYFDEHLNGAKSTGNKDQDKGGNVYVSTADDGNQPVCSLKKVKNVIYQFKNPIRRTKQNHNYWCHFLFVIECCL